MGRENKPKILESITFYCHDRSPELPITNLQSPLSWSGGHIPNKMLFFLKATRKIQPKIATLDINPNKC